MESHCFYAGVHDQNDETNLLQLPLRSESLHNILKSSSRSNNIIQADTLTNTLDLGITFHCFYTKIHNNQRTKIPFLQVGGSLGLWLGLGALQVLQQMINMTQSIFERLHIGGGRKKRTDKLGPR